MYNLPAGAGMTIGYSDKMFDPLLWVYFDVVRYIFFRALASECLGSVMLNRSSTQATIGNALTFDVA